MNLHLSPTRRGKAAEVSPFLQICIQWTSYRQRWNIRLLRGSPGLCTTTSPPRAYTSVLAQKKFWKARNLLALGYYWYLEANSGVLSLSVRKIATFNFAAVRGRDDLRILGLWYIQNALPRWITRLSWQKAIPAMSCFKK